MYVACSLEVQRPSLCLSWLRATGPLKLSQKTRVTKEEETNRTLKTQQSNCSGADGVGIREEGKILRFWLWREINCWSTELTGSGSREWSPDQLYRRHSALPSSCWVESVLPCSCWMVNDEIDDLVFNIQQRFMDFKSEDYRWIAQSVKGFYCSRWMASW